MFLGRATECLGRPHVTPSRFVYVTAVGGRLGPHPTLFRRDHPLLVSSVPDALADSRSSLFLATTTTTSLTVSSSYASARGRALNPRHICKQKPAPHRAANTSLSDSPRSSGHVSTRLSTARRSSTRNGTSRCTHPLMTPDTCTPPCCSSRANHIPHTISSTSPETYDVADAYRSSPSAARLWGDIDRQGMRWKSAWRIACMLRRVRGVSYAPF